MESKILMPSRLTAENGAKYLMMMGNFKESIELDCPECFIDSPDVNCDICEGNYTYLQRVDVSWSTIKQIYTRAVSALGGEEK